MTTPTKKIVAKKKRVLKKPLAESQEDVQVDTKTVKQATSERYVYAVGRRKTSIAQVRLFPNNKEEGTLVNKRPILEYFGTEALKAVALSPLQATGLAFAITIVVRGGGLHGQAGAIKLGVARALFKYDPLLRPTLKAQGFLTRDSRAVERKKPGLKKARRSPQWAKR